MRTTLLLLAVVVAAVAASGASAATPTPIVFGIEGGNAIAYHVTIQPNGSVRASQGWTVRKQILPRQVRRLRLEIQNAHLRSRVCPGTLPDFAAKYIRLGGHTFRVRGQCEPRFTRVFGDLVAAVRLRAG